MNRVEVENTKHNEEANEDIFKINESIITDLS
jgi:hypothetical protein